MDLRQFLNLPTKLVASFSLAGVFCGVLGCNGLLRIVETRFALYDTDLDFQLFYPQKNRCGELIRHMSKADIFDSLMTEIHFRVAALPEGSYTTKLLKAGSVKIGSKILEEVLETVIAAKAAGVTELNTDSREHLIREACDVIYHLWVLIGSKGITVDDIRTELKRREGMSGLEEKRSRTIEAKS